MEIGELPAFGIHQDPVQIGRIQPAVGAGIARVGQAGEIIPLVVHMDQFAADGLRQLMPQSHGISAGAGQDFLRKAKLGRPEFTNHVEIALKAAGREDHGLAPQFAFVAGAQLAHQDSDHAAPIRQRLVGQ